MNCPEPNTEPKQKILFLVHRVPFPPDKGDRIRTFQFLRHLAPRAEVHLACLADEPVDSQAVVTLQKYCKQIAIAHLGGISRWPRAFWSLARGKTATEGAFRSGTLRAILRQWTKRTRFDIALASSSALAQYLQMPELADIPAIIDLIDVDSQKWLDYASAGLGPKSWLYRLEGARLRRLEKKLTTWAKALSLVSEAEVNIFRGFCQDGNVQAIGNGVDLDYFHPRPAKTETGCVFLGALDYKPNVEGILWFCEKVWPNIFQRFPEASFSLVGRRPTPAIARLADIPGVQVVGQVPDVRPYLANAALSMVPLHIARGIQNKVLESMAMAKATIVSSPALEGIKAIPGQHLLAANSPAEWMEATATLLNNAAKRRQIGEAGRAFVETYHRWENCLQPLDHLIGRPCARATPQFSRQFSCQGISS